MDEMIEADVPLEPTGTPEGVKTFRRICSSRSFVRSRSNVCRAILPDVITVDVSHLNIGDAIHVREIPLPERRDNPHVGRSDRLLGPRADGGGRTGGSGCGSSCRSGSDHGEEGSAGRWRRASRSREGCACEEKEAKK